MENEYIKYREKSEDKLCRELYHIVYLLREHADKLERDIEKSPMNEAVVTALKTTELSKNFNFGSIVNLFSDYEVYQYLEKHNVEK